VGEGEFGTVHKATWHRTLVAVKVLRASDEVALGDFRRAGLHDVRLVLRERPCAFRRCCSEPASPMPRAAEQ